MSTIIELKEISFSYGNRKILDKVNMAVNSGEFISIAGESGSGKSTLLYILARFIKPDSGTYLFENSRPAWAPFFRRKNIGFLFQDFRLLPFLTVEKNIAFPQYFSGRHIQQNTIREMMSKLNIETRRKAKPDSISGGEAQRTALARALLMNPKVLLLDEPSGNLDAETEKKLIQIFLDLKDESKTLICVTHSAEIMKASDRILDLKKSVFVERTGKKTGGKKAGIK